jgi:hypothetical protein
VNVSGSLKINGAEVVAGGSGDSGGNSTPSSGSEDLTELNTKTTNISYAEEKGTDISGTVNLENVNVSGSLNVNSGDLILPSSGKIKIGDVEITVNAQGHLEINGYELWSE